MNRIREAITEEQILLEAHRDGRVVGSVRDSSQPAKETIKVTRGREGDPQACRAVEANRGTF